ncbi:MAG: ribonuclease P protein component [Bacteroidetes bacterium]|nr:ribonuclease P protein component [Bacteroidota bacterium]
MKETPRLTFLKKEKLTQHHLIERMFAHTHPSLTAHPIKMVYFFVEKATQSPDIQVLMLVSKRSLKNATQRNYVKRRMRESYRMNKQILIDKLSKDSSKQLVAMFIYTNKQLSSFQMINQSFIKITAKFEVH